MSGGESSWCRAQELKRTLLSTTKFPVYNVGTGQENRNKWSLLERKVVGDTERSLVKGHFEILMGGHWKKALVTGANKGKIHCSLTHSVNRYLLNKRKIDKADFIKV